MRLIARPFVRVLLSALAVAFLCAGCGEKGAAGGGGGGRGGGAAPVFVSTAVRKEVPLVIEAIGAVEPIQTAAIRSQVTGVLQKIAIKEGQDVNSGDLLFEIDARPFQNALASAQADRKRILGQLETARVQVARYTTLSGDSMVSKEQLQKIQSEANSLEAQALASEAAVANATLQLSHCSIRAPISGRTGNLGVHEGDLVRSNENTTTLVTINQLSPIYVTFGVPQQHLAAIARFRAAGTLPVKVTPPGAGEAPEEGELTFIDNTVDAQTGTIRLKATLPNAQHRLWPGQFSSVGVTLSKPLALVVPASALQTSQSGQHVFTVIADNIAEMKQVTVERMHDGEAVIAKGLNEGDIVVVDGQLRVVPGRSVDVKTPGAIATGSKEGRGGKAAGKGKKKET
jgi:membrane fusion protein, multidrug efflux system